MPIVNRFADLHPEIAAWRHDIHAHPELRYDVYRTAGFVAERLKAFGCDEVATGIGQTGVVGVTCGRRLGKNFLTLLQIGRVRSRVRPVCAARVAAGPNALRGSGPNPSHAFKDALTLAGSPEPRNDRICITSLCPRQFRYIFLAPLTLMPLPAATSAH